MTDNPKYARLPGNRVMLRKRKYSRLPRIRVMLRHMPLWDVVRVLFLSAIRRRRRLKVHIGNVRLFVRTRTADLRVAFSSLVDGEFDGIGLDNAAVIIDAGANIGTSAIAFSKIHPNATVFAIEPEAENFAMLEENVSPWSNIRPVRAAIAAVPGERSLFDRGTGPWGYTITDSPQTIVGLGQTVRCLTVSGVLDEFGIASVDVLKLDIEGGEKEVLKHSEEWIEKVRVIVAELHDKIIPGCEDAFKIATRSFEQESKFGEKVVAYRSIAG